MKVVSVALAATYSAVLSLQGLDTNGPIGFSLSVGQTVADVFELYGTLDAAAIDNTNAQILGQFSGGSSALPKGIADQARTWPFVLIRRIGGATAGTFAVAGNPAASPAVVTVAAPVVVGAYSALITMTTIGAENIRIGGARQQTAADVFDVWVSDDPALASSTGAKLAARITGGGGTLLISAMVSGFNYAIVQRVSGTTAGNIIAAGVSPSSGGGVLNLTTLAVGDTAVNGPIGALTAAQSVDTYSEFLLTQTTAGVTATLPNPTDTTPGKFAKVNLAPASTNPLTMYGEVINPGDYQIFNWTTVWEPSGNITQNGNAFGAPVVIGSNDAQATRLRSVGTTFLADDGTTLTAGRTTGASATLIQSGTGGAQLLTGTPGLATSASGINIGTSANGAIQMVANGSGTITIDSTTGTITVGTGASDKTLTMGSLTNVSATSLRGGTGGVLIQSAGVGPINIDSVGAGPVNIGTTGLASKTITIGVVTGTTALQLSAGSGGIGMSTTGAITGSTSSNGDVRFTANGTGNVQLTPGATGAVLLPPRAAGAGNTTRLAFRELAAGGTNAFTLQAPDALAADVNATLPIDGGVAGAVGGGNILSSSGGLTPTLSFVQFQSGTAAIGAAGVSAAIAANITASSRIVITVKDFVASTAVGLEAKAADRTVGAPGSFIVTAYDAAAAAVAGANGTTFDWFIVG